jgi:hypothetical protein
MKIRSRINHYFFDESNQLHNEIISLHDFVLPAASAIWNFREIIQSEIRADRLVSVKELSDKYNTAPRTRGSTNLITPFCDISWDEQREKLAEIALVNIIAIYEIWCDEICEAFGLGDLAIKLQFPTNGTATKGVRSAITELIGSGKSWITDSIYPSMKATKKYSFASLDNLLKCFRYFKELRNCYMHRGRKCDGKLFGSQSQFIPVANKADLGMKFVPEYCTYNIGDDIHLSLHGVLGFTEVILRIVSTIDAEICQSKYGELSIKKRLEAMLSAPIREKRLFSAFNTMGMKNVVITNDLVRELMLAVIVI